MLGSTSPPKGIPCRRLKEHYRFHLRAVMFEGVFSGLLWSAPRSHARLWCRQSPFDADRHGTGSGSGGCSLLGWFEDEAKAIVEESGDGGALAASLTLLLVPMIANWAQTDEGMKWVLFFLILVTVQALASVPITSAINGVIRSNYRDENRGFLFGKVQLGSPDLRCRKCDRRLLDALSE